MFSGERMVTNAKVAEMWAHGEDASSQHLKSKRGCLWSYELLIGITIPTVSGLLRTEAPYDVGRKIVYDYTAKTNHFYSSTTSSHVGLAKRYSHGSMNPSYEVLFDVTLGNGEVIELLDPKQLPFVLADGIDKKHKGIRPKVNEIYVKELLDSKRLRATKERDSVYALLMQ